MDNSVKRLDYIDALKGFGIILMVLGHMHFGYANCEKYIFGFHMPLFFLASGYLYKTPERLAYSIRKKMQGLLIPYFVFGLGYYVIWYFQNRYSGADLKLPLRAVLWDSVEGLQLETALWFLMVLFWAWLLYALIDRGIRDFWWKTFLIIIISVIGCLWKTLFAFRLPWGWQAAFAVQILFWLGQMYRRWEHSSDFRKIWEEQHVMKKTVILVVGILINAVFIYRNGMTNVRISDWPGYAAAYVNAVAAVWLYAELIRCIQTVRWIDKTAGYVIKRIGKFSIVWVCLNHQIIELAKNITVKYVTGVESPLLLQAIIVVLSIGILYMIAELIMNTKLRVLVGKL